MLKSILNAFKSPDLRKKIGFTFALLALYRLGTFVPVPGVDAQSIANVNPIFFRRSGDLKALRMDLST